MERCEFIIQNENQLIQCKGKQQKKYGSYCNKHKRNYLIDENNLLITDRFTFSIKDYLIKDLMNYYYLKIKDEKLKQK